MIKVRRVWAVNNDGEKVLLFVYRGYYCLRNGKAAYHTNKYLRDGVKLNNISDNDVFTLDSRKFSCEECFKKIVDDHIKYINYSFGSLTRYFALNSWNVNRI